MGAEVRGRGGRQKRRRGLKQGMVCSFFWVLSQTMKLTSCHAALAATFHNVFLFTVETGPTSL